ncbi:hypothetical protein [Ekhidna sp.]|uniref:hypothetical protein n=1 Tax=Ekhidna sp. TaxID=2608089 RepID=UPI0032F04204
MKQKYLVFGKVIELNTIDSREGKLLHNELSVYPLATQGPVDLQINYVLPVKSGDVIGRNPSTHSLRNDGFDFTMGPVTISYWFEQKDITRIDFSIKRSSTLMSTLNKLMNIQFTNHKEAIGQWFHEFVIVPLGFVLDGRALLHSSAVMTPERKAILFGGTGGVGKTSLEIELCKHQDCSFLTDDISFVSDDGDIFPNLAYPKIYGYNIKGDPKTRKEVFKGKGVINRFFFWLHSLRGDQYVRRRMSPAVFYGKVQNEKVSIQSYLILSKMDVDRIELKPLEVDKALNLSQKVIEREYQTFIDHLVWHDYNSILADKEPIISEKKLLSKNQTILQSALNKIDNIYLVKIPLHLPHAEFKSQMIQVLKDHKIL